MFFELRKINKKIWYFDLYGVFQKIHFIFKNQV